MKEKINELIKETMKELINAKKNGKNCEELTVKLETYKSIKSEFKNKETSDNKPNLKPGETLEIIVLESMVKNHEKSIEAYNNAGRLDLAKLEEEQLKIIKTLLPEEATSQEIASEIGNYILENNLEGNIPRAKMGDCINYVKQKLLPKKTSGKLVSSLIKNLLL